MQVELPVHKTYSGALFFIKDNIADGDINLENFQIGKMLGYHFTKPLQGKIFREFRAEIQGITDDAGGGWICAG